MVEQLHVECASSFLGMCIFFSLVNSLLTRVLFGLRGGWYGGRVSIYVRLSPEPEQQCDVRHSGQGLAQFSGLSKRAGWYALYNIVHLLLSREPLVGSLLPE